MPQAAMFLGCFLFYFFFFCVFNLEAAHMCQWEVTRQEVVIECGCVGELSLVEVDDERF